MRSTCLLFRLVYKQMFQKDSFQHFRDKDVGIFCFRNNVWTAGSVDILFKEEPDFDQKQLVLWMRFNTVSALLFSHQFRKFSIPIHTQRTERETFICLVNNFSHCLL